MKKLLFLFTVLLTYTSTQAQTALPYYTGFDDASQKMGWTEYRVGDMGSYHWNYETFNAYSAPEVLSHYYPVGGTQLTVNWFVSPQFDLSLGGMIDSLRYAFSGFGTVMPDDTVAIYLLEGSQDPQLATSKTLLFDFRDTIYKNDNVWRKLEGISIPAASSNAYIAFKYVTTFNWLDVRFDNLALSGNGIGTVEKPALAKVELFPNPASDYVKLAGVEEGYLTLYDIQGKKLKEQWVEGGEKVAVGDYEGMLLYTLKNKDSSIIGSGKLLLQAR